MFKTIPYNSFKSLEGCGNKTLSVAAYLSQSQSPLLLNALSVTTASDGPIDVFEALKKDIDKTAKTLASMQDLIKWADKEGNISLEKKGQANLKDLFIDAYNNDKRQLTILGISLNLDRPKSVDQIKDDLLNALFKGQVDLNRYNELYRLRNKLFHYSKQSAHSMDEKIGMMAAIVTQPVAQQMIDTAIEIRDNYNAYRHKQSRTVIGAIDKQVGNRAALDAIVKHNTYIGTDGIEQVARTHRDKPELEKIQAMLANHAVFEGFEVDIDSKLESIIDLLEQTQDLKPAYGGQGRAIGAVRKMGNLRACGMYMDLQRKIAFDLEHPDSVIHEIMHFVDFSNQALRSSGQREQLISILKRRLETSDVPLPKKLFHYYHNPDEIIARSGEIGYIFSHFDLKDDESMDEFIDRVEAIQHDKNCDSKLSLVESIKSYTSGTHATAYFDVRTMPRKVAKLVREYFEACIGCEYETPKPMPRILSHGEYLRIEAGLSKHDIDKADSYQLRCTSVLNHKAVRDLIDLNVKTKTVPNTKLIERLMVNITHLQRSTQSLPRENYRYIQSAMADITDWVREQDDRELDHALFNSMMRCLTTSPNTRRKFNLTAVGIRHAMLQNPSNDNIWHRFENRDVYDKPGCEKLLSDLNQHNKYYYEMGHIHNYKQQMNMYHSTKNSRGRTTTTAFHEESINTIMRPAIEHMKTLSKEGKLKATLAHLRVDDPVLIGLLSDQAMLDVLPYDEGPMLPYLRDIAVNRGLIQRVIKAKDTVILDGNSYAPSKNHATDILHILPATQDLSKEEMQQAISVGTIGFSQLAEGCSNLKESLPQVEDEILTKTSTLCP